MYRTYNGRHGISTEAVNPYQEAYRYATLRQLQGDLVNVNHRPDGSITVQAGHADPLTFERSTTLCAMSYEGREALESIT